MNALIAKIELLWGREPVVITAVIDGVLMVLVAFGLPITNDQKTAIDTLLAAIGVLIARSQVSPA